MANMPSDAWLEAPRPRKVAPELKALLVALRQALYIIADALGDYAGLERRPKAG